ncbi:hypothetical protein LPB67_11615 [Undibacterium sp. Jales W-56]|uniref:hypothetical protein n=1 Tax=Undibacterium sp. Jales W-56 TaxID=2897325 RepID=UPI0021CF72DA|nr:hypothetical protein [Undibacterium sp. Jales W-56]MCU6434420.1 hypothetical protein [Undibacterium sp. Jales W-56]
MVGAEFVIAIFMKNCWICGDLADSAEHMIKASNIKAMFGKIDNGHPLFRRIDDEKHERIAGIKSEKLKFEKSLCSGCNNARTQKHDKAWEKLSNYLLVRSPKIDVGERIRLRPVFNDGLRKGMLGVHLYFLKLFGCLIIENEIPLDSQEFANCILNDYAHPNVYLSFLVVKNQNIKKQAAISQVTYIQKGEFVSAQWMYIVGSIAVNVTLASSVRPNKREVHLWHPTSFDKHIVLDQLGKRAY